MYIPESVNRDTARIRKMELVVDPVDWLDFHSGVKLVATVYDLEANKKERCVCTNLKREFRNSMACKII